MSLRIARVAVVLGNLAVLLYGSSGLAGAAPPTPGAPAGQVSIANGLRGVVADVFLDGRRVLQTFQPERTTEPFGCPPGRHRVEVRLSGAAAGTPSSLSGQFDVTSGARMSVVVHLSAAGQPTLSVFTDDVSRVPTGSSRLVLRNVAQTDPVDIRFDMLDTAHALGPGGQVSRAFDPRTYTVYVYRSGQNAPLIPPHVMPLTPGTANFMYLIGSASQHDLEWIAERVTSLSPPPTSMPMGVGGPRRGTSPPPALLALLGALALVAVTTPALRRRPAPARRSGPASGPRSRSGS